MSNIVVVYNPSSGRGDRLDDIKQAFAVHHVEPDYIAVTDHRLRQQLTKVSAKKSTTIVAAGGDGTINTVAQVVRGTNCKLGIVPTGTLNHFAKALHIPLDISTAVARIIKGHTRRVDMGGVNGHGFVNNSSIGLYPRSLRTREAYRQRLGKWPAAALGFVGALIVLRLYHVELSLKGKQVRLRTPFVLIANNSYRRAPNIGERTSLNGGQLAVYIMSAHGALPSIRMLVHALFTRRYRTQDFEVYLTQTCTIRTKHHRRLNVACDGEVLHMRTPLHYQSQPQTLRVIT